MTDEQWNTCQSLIEAGQIEAVLPVLKEELLNELSEEQLLPLGDLDESLRSVLSNPTSTPIKTLIFALIEFAKKGMIKVKSNK